MSPRASIHSAAPYVPQLSTVRRMPARTADGASGSKGAIAFTTRPSHRAVGRQTSTRTVATAARPASARRSGGALCGVTAATTATPLPSDTAWMTKADAAAGPGSTPARWASTTRRSEEHTSELQSHSDLVCRLLLEKKKKKQKTIILKKTTN